MFGVSLLIDGNPTLELDKLSLEMSIVYVCSADTFLFVILIAHALNLLKR